MLITLTFLAVVRVPPNFAEGLLRPVSCTNNKLEFEFTGEPGKLYRIDYSLDLVTWGALGGLVATNHPASLSITNIHVMNRLFFRAVEVPSGSNSSEESIVLMEVNRSVNTERIQAGEYPPLPPAPPSPPTP